MRRYDEARARACLIRRRMNQGANMNPSDKTYNALFLCTGNSARSVMAEAILNRKGGSRFRAYSAGSHPKGAVHPFTLDLLEKRGFDISTFRSKSWNEFAGPDAPVMEFVITVCDSAAGEVCPIWPGHPMTEHWGFPDPAAFEGSESETRAFFARVYGQIERRVEIFLSLRLEALDRPSLQKEMRAVGETDLDRGV